MTNTQPLLDFAVRSIKAQQAAQITMDLIRAGQCHPDFLSQTIDAIDDDCRRDFLRQIQKLIIQGN